MTTRSASVGACASRTGPTATATIAHPTTAAPAPMNASRQRRLAPTASTIASASSSSTPTATAAPAAVRTHCTLARTADRRPGAVGLPAHRRQAQEETAAGPGLGVDLAPARAREPTRQREAEPGAAAVGARGAHAGIEDRVEVAWRARRRRRPGRATTTSVWLGTERDLDRRARRAGPRCRAADAGRAAITFDGAPARVGVTDSRARATPRALGRRPTGLDRAARDLDRIRGGHAGIDLLARRVSRVSITPAMRSVPARMRSSAARCSAPTRCAAPARPRRARR